jgi:hypothetical protein
MLLVEAAQTRVERHLDQHTDGEAPLASLTSSLGLNVLADLEALLERHLSGLQAFTTAFESMRLGGPNPEALDVMEQALSVLLSCIEPAGAGAGAQAVVSPRDRPSASDEVHKILRSVKAPAAVQQIGKRLAEGGYTIEEAALMMVECLDSEDMVALAKGLLEHANAVLTRLENLRSSPACESSRCP